MNFSWSVAVNILLYKTRFRLLPPDKMTPARQLDGNPQKEARIMFYDSVAHRTEKLQPAAFCC